MGQVLLGVDQDGRRVACKIVLAELAADPGFRERFRREIEIATAAPPLVTAPFVAADPDAARPWLATAFIDGPSLKDLVAMRGPLPAAEIPPLAGRIAAALAALHAAGVVHRDLKPSNVLLDADSPRLIDFGIARAVGSATITITGHVIGTPSFMSPEQVESTRGIGSASDIFSFGAVIAFLCTGRSPFESESVAATLYKVAHGSPDLEGLTEPLGEVVRACLSRDPDARPTAAQLEVALLTDARLPVRPGRIEDGGLADPAAERGVPDVSAGSPDTVIRDAPRHRSVRAVGSRRRRRRLWAMGGAASIAAASVAAGLFVGPGLLTEGKDVLPGPPGPAEPVTAQGQLLANVLPDECLLSVAAMSSLVEQEVDDLRQGRIDGGPLGCVARVDGSPVALVNVYEVAVGSPSDVVTASAAQGRGLLDGVDRPAVLVNADAGPTLQVAGPRYLATIQVMGLTPSRSRWADAGDAALLSMPE